MDFFKALGVPRRFSLDKDTLQSRFYELSRELHPDRYATRGAADRAQALIQMSEINGAYQTLSDPDARRLYLLELEGALKPNSGKRGVPTELAARWFDLQDEGGDFGAFLAEIDTRLTALDQSIARSEAEFDAGAVSALGALVQCLDERSTLLSLRRDVTKAVA